MSSNMNIRRFVADNSRNALRQVREALGGDAIILSNRSVEGGVEILAAPAGAVEALTRAVKPEPVPVAQPVKVAAPAPVAVPKAEPAETPEAARSRFSSLFARRTRAEEAKDEKAASPAVDAYAQSFADRLAEVENDADDFVTQLAPQAVAMSRPVAVVAPAPVPTVVVEEPAAPMTLVAPSTFDTPKTPDSAGFSREEMAAVVRREVSEEVSREISRELGRDVVNDMTRDVTRDVTQAVTRDVTQFVSADVARQFQALHAEINEKLATVSWTEAMRRQPGRTKLMQELILSGFSPALSRHIQERLPDDFSHEEARTWAQGVLRRNLPVAADAEELINEGGVYALVGPTGVGKTTTVAKLAARFAMKHGVDKLALITTDGFRIGAQDQLRIYGKILGIPVHSIHDQASLTSTIEQLSSKKLILIDTAGLGPRDERVTEQIAMLRGAKAKRLVVLNATVDAETLDYVITTFADRDFAGCVLSKTDEAMRLGPVLDAVIRHRLKIHHVSTGQRVPEDLDRPDAEALVRDALQRTGKPAFDVHAADEPVWMSAMAERAGGIDQGVLSFGTIGGAHA